MGVKTIFLERVGFVAQGEHKHVAKKVRLNITDMAGVTGGIGSDDIEEDVFQFAVYCHACWNFGVPPVSYLNWIELGRPLTASS